MPNIRQNVNSTTDANQRTLTNETIEIEPKREKKSKENAFFLGSANSIIINSLYSTICQRFRPMRKQKNQTQRSFHNNRRMPQIHCLTLPFSSSSLLHGFVHYTEEEAKQKKIVCVEKMESIN